MRKRVLLLCMVLSIIMSNIFILHAKAKSIPQDFSMCKGEEFDITNLANNLSLSGAINEYPIIKQIYYVGLTDAEVEKMGFDISKNEKNTTKTKNDFENGNKINAKEFLSCLNARRPKVVKEKKNSIANDKSIEMKVNASINSENMGFYDSSAYIWNLRSLYNDYYDSKAVCIATPKSAACYY